MIVLYHRGSERGGPKACGGPAVGILKSMRLPLEYLPADNVAILPDGRQPNRGEPMICYTCKEAVFASWLEPVTPDQYQPPTLGHIVAVPRDVYEPA